MTVLLTILISLISSHFLWVDKRDLNPYQIMGYAQGTSYHITYYAEDEEVTKDQLEYLLAGLDSSLSIYKPYALISRFNRSAEGITMDRHLRKVVEKSLEISAHTEGLFDITVQPLVQAWGFGTEKVDEAPDAAAIKSLLHCVGSEKLSISGNWLSKVNPCVKIDVNGIAQGYSVDVLAHYLERKGIVNYLVEIGGEIRIKGHKPGNRPMSIGLEGPGGDAGKPFPIRRIIQPSDGAVTTSGHYRNYYMDGDVRISHLINATTGYPIRNGTISVTVWAPNAMTADAYDNALIAMGVEEGLAFAEKEKELEAYFIYKTTEGIVADTATTGFYDIFREPEL